MRVDRRVPVPREVLAARGEPGSLQLFDMVWIMTGGGPANATTTMATYLIGQGSERQNFGIAGAASVILFVIGFVMALLYQLLVLRRDTQPDR